MVIACSYGGIVYGNPEFRRVASPWGLPVRVAIHLFY